MADAQNFGAAKVGYWDRWEKDSFSYNESEWLKHEYRGPGLQEIAEQLK